VLCAFAGCLPYQSLADRKAHSALFMYILDTGEMDPRGEKGRAYPLQKIKELRPSGPFVNKSILRSAPASARLTKHLPSHLVCSYRSLGSERAYLWV
jgi:hypothetical protein